MLEYFGTVGASVVIPTLNAGSEFRLLLEMLRSQKEVVEIEVIVVDSGSCDETVALAMEYDAKVIEIPKEQFSHSYARNLGAEAANQDYLVFLTQDAMPENEFWLINLLKPLLDKGNEIVASTCVEQPKNDADLFSRVAIFNQIRWLDVEGKNRVLKLPQEIMEGETRETLIRKNACLNDVACAYRKEVFLRYRYRMGYAEDFDMGKRLIEDGYKLALLGNTKVIHSHNRSGMYYLRRMLVERIALYQIMDGTEKTNITEEEFIVGTLWFYDKLVGWIHEIEKTPLQYSKFAILNAIQEICTLDAGFELPIRVKIKPHETLTAFIEELKGYHGQIADGIMTQQIGDKFYQLFAEKLAGIIGYLWNREGELSLKDMMDICSTLYCLYGNVVGTLFGDLVLGSKELKYLDKMYQTLSKGI